MQSSGGALLDSGLTESPHYDLPLTNRQSNPSSSAKKCRYPSGYLHFLLLWRGIRTHLNAKLRWSFARFRLDGIDTLRFAFDKSAIESLILIPMTAHPSGWLFIFIEQILIPKCCSNIRFSGNLEPYDGKVYPGELRKKSGIPPWEEGCFSAGIVI